MSIMSYFTNSFNSLIILSNLGINSKKLFLECIVKFIFLFLPEDKSEKKNEDNGVKNETENSRCSGNSNGGSLGSKNRGKDFVSQLVNNS